jgi:hypothetical protein
MNDFWEWAQRLSAVIAAFSLPYLVIRERRSVTKLSYEFSGSSGESYEKDGKEYRIFTFHGYVKNHSLHPNSITKIYMIVWKNKHLGSTLRLGYGRYDIETDSGGKLQLPLLFNPRESKKLVIKHDTIITGTADEKILKEFYELTPGSKFYLPKHTYELAFEDSDGNIFDQNGKLISLKLMNLNWSIENTFDNLKDGKYLPFVKQKMAINRERTKLKARRIARWIGVG